MVVSSVFSVGIAFVVSVIGSVAVAVSFVSPVVKFVVAIDVTLVVAIVEFRYFQHLSFSNSTYQCSGAVGSSTLPFLDFSMAS